MVHGCSRSGLFRGYSAALSGPRRVMWRRLAGLMVGVVVLVGCGARNETGGRKSPPPMDSTIVLDTAENAACTLLHLVVAHLDAIEAHDRTTAETTLDQVAWYVAAREDLLARYQAVLRDSAEDPDEVLRACAENWAAIISYYADGIEWETVAAEPLTSTVAQAVRVSARGPDHETVLRVACLRSEDGTWHVSRVAFAKPSYRMEFPVTVKEATSLPVGAPSSAPASTTAP